MTEYHELYTQLLEVGYINSIGYVDADGTRGTVFKKNNHVIEVKYNYYGIIHKEAYYI